MAEHVEQGAEDRQPDRIQIGASLVLVSLEGLAMMLGAPDTRQLEELLRAADIKRLKFPWGPKRYVSLFPLEMGLFQAGMPSGGYTGTDASNMMVAYQELAGLLYGGLTRKAIADRTKELVKTLTKAHGGNQRTDNRRSRGPRPVYRHLQEGA